MLQESIPIFILACIAVLIGLSIILLAELFGPKKYAREKGIPYECGVTPFGAPRHPFAVKYYLVALFFLIFDVEVLFFYPWAVIFRKFLTLGPTILIEMLIFILFLAVAFLYVWRKGALEW